VEVAHDIQKSVSNYCTAKLKVINSYDTWHGNAIKFSLHVLNITINAIPGTKNVKKSMLKLSKGRVRDMGVSWFPELVDKSKFSCFYW
jgi:hypothetical protein